jgi:hypothetical protein
LSNLTGAAIHSFLIETVVLHLRKDGQQATRVIRRLDEIAQRLQSLMEVADDNGHTLLAYLINMAEVEAHYVADEHRKHLKN